MTRAAHRQRSAERLVECPIVRCIGVTLFLRARGQCHPAFVAREPPGWGMLGIAASRDR